MTLPPFTLHHPTSIDQALELLAHYGQRAQVIAGGTDLLPSMKQRLFTPEHVISLAEIKALRGVSAAGVGGAVVGACTTLRDVIGSDMETRYPAVVQAALAVGTPLIQNTATVGGNLLLDTRCLFYNQSAHWRTALGGCLKRDGDICHVAPGSAVCLAAFSAELVPALMAYGAKVEIASLLGRRCLPLADLYRPGDGAHHLAMGRSELLVGVHVPAPDPGQRVLYRKVRLRQAIDFALMGVAVSVWRGGGDQPRRVAAWLTGVHTHPVSVDLGHMFQAGASLEAQCSKAAAAVADACQPLGTHGVTPGYRLRLIRVHTRRLLHELFEAQAAGGAVPPSDPQ